MLHDRGGPLAGIRILELTKVWAGPYTGKLLAFLGAEVIKVESLNQLDEMRAYGGTSINNAPYFLSVNQEVLSAQINMKSKEGMNLLHQLIKESDVLLDNLRPGAMQRLGLDYESVCAIKPNIIQASIKMYGNDGPLSHHTGYAPCFAALGGLTSLVGHEGEPPRGMNIRYGDSTVGASAAFAIVAALHHRETTGEGQFIDISAVETMSTLIGDGLFSYSCTGIPPRADANYHSDFAPHGCYPCANQEWLSLAISDDVTWAKTCSILDINAPELAHKSHRLQKQSLVDQYITEALIHLSAADVSTKLRDAGCYVFKVMSSLDLVSDDFLWESQAYRMVSDAQGDSRPIITSGWYMEPDGAEIIHGAPQIGEHNAYVFGNVLGYSENDIAELKAKQAIL